MVEDGRSANNVPYDSANHFKGDAMIKINACNNVIKNGRCVVEVEYDEQEDVTDDERRKLNLRCHSAADTSVPNNNNFDKLLNYRSFGSRESDAFAVATNDVNDRVEYSRRANCSDDENADVGHFEIGQRFKKVTNEQREVEIRGTESQEIHKTIFAFGMLVLNFFLTTTSLAIIHDKVPPYGPLPDAVLSMVTARDWALTVSEILIIVTTGIMLVIIVLHPLRFVIFRRLFLLLSLLYFMRSVTMFVTVLPVSSSTYYCSPKLNKTDISVVLNRSLSLFFGMGLTINGKHIYCGDYIFSGHTTILVMSYLMISEYSCRRIVLLHWAVWLMSLTGVLMVLISHSHYTIDVIAGYFVTTRLFWMYHTCANNATLKLKSSNNCLSREWWFFLFQYFEGNVKSPIQPLEFR